MVTRKRFGVISILLMVAVVVVLGVGVFKTGIFTNKSTPPEEQKSAHEGDLPPDPGEAGKATLEGIDSDGDGVRDDIQRYIALTYPQSEKTRAALTQLAKTQQAFLLDANNKELSRRHAHERDDALDCLSYIYGIGTDTTYAISSELRAQMLNTLSRSEAYVIADGKLGGLVSFSTPEVERKLRCDFDPDAMRN